MPASYKTILVAIDASDEADQVLEAALAMAARGSSRIRVVTVVPPVMSGVSGLDGASFSATWPLQELEQAATREITDNVRERTARFGVPPGQVDVLVGRPATEIHDHARRIEADLIVIGSHGRHAVSRLMLGSTANGVVHGARCDVLTVRIRDLEP